MQVKRAGINPARIVWWLNNQMIFERVSAIVPWKQLRHL
jgi:hypothetical protein